MSFFGPPPPAYDTAASRAIAIAALPDGWGVVDPSRAAIGDRFFVLGGGVTACPVGPDGAWGWPVARDDVLDIPRKPADYVVIRRCL